MIKFISTVIAEETGAPAFAYGLIVVLIALAAIATLVTMGSG